MDGTYDAKAGTRFPTTKWREGYDVAGGEAGDGNAIDPFEPRDRIGLNAMTSPQAQVPEVHVFVR